MMDFLFLSFLVIFYYVSVACSQESMGYNPLGFTGENTSSLAHTTTLLKTTLLGYETRIRPRLDQNQPVSVNMTFFPNAIVNFDTTGQKMDVMGFTRVTWEDELFTWDPDKYSGTNFILVPLHDIWYPKLVIDKSYDGSGTVGLKDEDSVRIHHTGLVRWVPNGIYGVLCDVDIKCYPFDEQICDLQFYVTDFSASDVTLNAATEVSTEYYSENSEWQFLKITTRKEMKYGSEFINVRFRVSRRSTFTVYTVIIPLTALSWLNVFTILVPVELGEKASLSITIFLAYSFIISITRDSIPHNSLQTSYFVTYVCILLLLSVLTVLYVMIESKIHFTVGEEPCRFKFAKCFPKIGHTLNFGHSGKFSSKNKVGNQDKVETAGERNKSKPKAQKEAKTISVKSLGFCGNQHDGDKTTYTWIDFLRTLDWLLFSIYIVVVIIVQVVTAGVIYWRQMTE